ncbi:hypothetical protein O3P69_016169, partial [Scylla paramamosain]
RPTFAQERCPQRPPRPAFLKSLPRHHLPCHLKMHNVALQHTTPQAGDSRAPLDRGMVCLLAVSEGGAVKLVAQGLTRVLQNSTPQQQQQQQEHCVREDTAC